MREREREREKERDRGSHVYCLCVGGSIFKWNFSLIGHLWLQIRFIKIGKASQHNNDNNYTSLCRIVMSFTHLPQDNSNNCRKLTPLRIHSHMVSS